MSRARVLAIGDTHVGMKRTHNEDTFMLADEDNLYVVADGMGGHASGEVASKMAVETLREFFRATSADPEATWPYKMDKALGYEENRLVTGIKLANLRIHEAAQKNPQMHSMGTTVAGILVVEDGVLIGHVGDSRAYHLTGGILYLRTTDHTLVHSMVEEGRLPPEAEKDHPMAHILTRALGVEEELEPEIHRGVVARGDRFLLCSDGLGRVMSDDEVGEWIRALRPTALEEDGSGLIEEANRRGAPDNVTVALLTAD